MVEQDIDMKMKIVLAAKKLFAMHGYDGTSVRQICEEAGANVALVSYYFGGKENVFYEVFEQFFPKGDKNAEFLSIEDPGVGMKAIIEGVVTLRNADPQIISIMQMEVITITPRVEKMRELVYPLWNKVRYLLDKGRQDGVFHFESLDSTFMFVLGSVFFYKQREFFELMFTEERPDIQTLSEQTATYVLNALGYQSKGES